MLACCLCAGACSRTGRVNLMVQIGKSWTTMPSTVLQTMCKPVWQFVESVQTCMVLLPLTCMLCYKIECLKEVPVHCVRPPHVVCVQLCGLIAHQVD